jgi:ketosteroid isomerase-like protein
VSVTEVADAFFRAIEQSDVNALTRFYDDELKAWHNFDGVTQTKAQNIELLATVLKHTRRIEYVVHERIVLGDRIAQRHQMNVETVSGKSFTMPVAFFLTIREGKIVRMEEYIDSAQLNPLFAEVAKQSGQA